MAEAENTRRRTQRDRDEAVKHAPAILAKDILVVADNLRRAIEHVPQDALAYDEALANLATGVEMTERLLLTAFEKHAIRQINPLGEKFDSNFHQAMFEVPGTGQPQGTVVQVMEPGYLIHDRLLRPALVGVAKGDAAAEAPPPADDPDDMDFLDEEETPPPERRAQPRFLQPHRRAAAGSGNPAGRRAEILVGNLSTECDCDDRLDHRSGSACAAAPIPH